MSHIFITKCLVWDKYLNFIFLFFQNVVYYSVFSIWYSNSYTKYYFLYLYSDFLDTKFYSLFGFSQHRIVFDIQYSVISENQIIFSYLFWSKKGICHTLILAVRLVLIYDLEHCFLLTTFWRF